RVEGVALGAQLGAQLGRGGTGHELVPARAVHLALDVFGVDVGLHDRSSLGEAREPTHLVRFPFPSGPWRSPSGTACCSWCCAACRSAAPAPTRLPAHPAPG